MRISWCRCLIPAWRQAIGYAAESGLSFRFGSREESLRWSHVIRAATIDPLVWSAHQAQSGARSDKRKARGFDRRLDRAWHDVEEDRADGA
jgi:hypothetical protein